MKQKYGSKILLVAADVYRPAAIDQLKTLGARLNIDVYSEGVDANPVQICKRAYSKGKVNNLCLDTSTSIVVN